MSRRNNRKLSKPKPDPTVLLALSIVPASQVANGSFERCGVSNHSDSDQRHMVRSGEKQTIRRRQPKIDELVRRKVISQREALACEWYASAHSMRYDTTGVTMRYGTAGGGSCTNFDHLPKSREQEDAYVYFTYAREGINPFFLPMFERIILYGRPLGKLGLSFRTAARELLARIEDKVAL